MQSCLPVCSSPTTARGTRYSWSHCKTRRIPDHQTRFCFSSALKLFEKLGERDKFRVGSSNDNFSADPPAALFQQCRAILHTARKDGWSVLIPCPTVVLAASGVRCSFKKRFAASLFDCFQMRGHRRLTDKSWLAARVTLPKRATMRKTWMDKGCNFTMLNLIQTLRKIVFELYLKYL